MAVTHSIKRLWRAIDYVTLRVKYTLLKPIGQVLYRGKKIWIVSERGTDARDNGYHLYRFIRQNHPEQEVYYIIDRKSADYPKVKKLGNAVQTDSLRHWLLYLGADIRISSQNGGLIPGKNWRFQKYIVRNKRGGKTVFLQHGITKDDMVGLYQRNTNIDLFICGAKPEYEYVLEKFGYSEEAVKYTGFSRFDALHQFTVKKQVLIMPTWRDWLSPNFHGSDLSQQDVANSSYIQSWRAFLNNDRLAAMAKQYQIQFVFYPHYEMQPFLELFGQPQEGVVFADFAHFDVQQLLKESMLLVTDYSSVYFDFAYMGKPVLYYQFDEEEYRKKHYAQGYFSYRRDGFGEVVSEEALLMDILEQYLANNCQMKPEYRQRIQGFFPLHDEKNCARIYKEIQTMR